MKTMNNILDTKALYIGDNGEIFCGDHAGMNAKTTGLDISGQPVQRVGDSEKSQFASLGITPRCECCGVEA